MRRSRRGANGCSNYDSIAIRCCDASARHTKRVTTTRGTGCGTKQKAFAESAGFAERRRGSSPKKEVSPCRDAVIQHLPPRRGDREALQWSPPQQGFLTFRSELVATASF